MATPHEANRRIRDDLVLAVASGESVAAFCRRTRLPRSTATSWQAQDDFSHDVEYARREMLDATLGKLAAASARAAEKLIALMDGRTEAIQRQAAEAVLEQLGKVAEIAELRERVDELERIIKESHGGGYRVNFGAN